MRKLEEFPSKGGEILSIEDLKALCNHCENIMADPMDIVQEEFKKENKGDIDIHLVGQEIVNLKSNLNIIFNNAFYMLYELTKQEETK